MWFTLEWHKQNTCNILVIIIVIRTLHKCFVYFFSLKCSLFCVSQPSAPYPREWEEEECGYDMRQEPSHMDGVRPQPTPRARPGTVPAGEAPSSHCCSCFPFQSSCFLHQLLSLSFSNCPSSHVLSHLMYHICYATLSKNDLCNFLFGKFLHQVSSSTMSRVWISYIQIFNLSVVIFAF